MTTIKSDVNSVRLGTPADLMSIMKLLVPMHDEESVEPVDHLKVYYTVERLLRHDGGVVGVIRDKGEIQGTVGLALEEVWYSSSKHLRKLWLFVPEAHRKSFHGRSMLEFSKLYADTIGIPLWADEICTPATEKKVDLVGRQLPQMGHVFLYNRRIREVV